MTTQTPFSVTLFSFMNAVTLAAIGLRSQSCAFIPVKEGSSNLPEVVNGAKQFNPSMGTTTDVLLDLNLNTLLTQSLGVDFTTDGAVTATQQTM